MSIFDFRGRYVSYVIMYCPAISSYFMSSVHMLFSCCIRFHLAMHYMNKSLHPGANALKKGREKKAGVLLNIARLFAFTE